MKEKISQIGNTNSGTLQRTTSKYEKSKVLQSKLEEMPVKEALQRKNSNANKAENVANDENNETKNSLKEKRYISIYNTEKDEYQIYQEKELLDTTKQEVVSENDKIEANNLKEYYASEGESRNNNMGILWITLSIVGVVIILFADKIEANNLKEYYASEGKSRNKNMGILWITLSIVGVVIILFAIKKRD